MAARSDLWKSNARCLQVRFRVVVDPIFSSSKLHCWIRTPSSSVFNRKRVSKNLEESESVIQRTLQAVAVPIIGNACHVFMHGLNRIQVLGLEKFHDALLHRPKGKALITVSNHVASVDDPFVIAALLPPRLLLDA